MALLLVRHLLRHPDEVRTVLEVTQITNETSLQDGQGAHPSSDTRNRRVLAVISHKDDWNPREEGCLFVFKYRRLNTPVAPAAGNVEPQEDLDVQMAFPIFGEFNIAMSQMRRQTAGIHPRGTSKINALRSVITLSITSAEGLLGHGSNLTFGATDVDGLKELVAECKRLKDAADLDPNHVAQSSTNFSWLRHYFAKRTTIAALTSVPQDIRQLTQEIHERLSPACAGHVEDEHSDVQILRDDWIRRSARDLSRRGSRRLLIRLGTFNVNGKMPSQDLSAWVQSSFIGKSDGKGKTESTIQPDNVLSSSSPLSPLQRFSPLSIPNPLGWISRRGTSNQTTEKVTETRELPMRVDEVDSDDPDLFVFGFQELDLSTEALLYSSSTTREDAWCYAIFAALGEKGVKYEKLASKQLVGMLIVIIVKKSLQRCFGEVRKAAVGAGLLGVMGNKGGTAIRLSFTPPELPQPGDRNSASDFVGIPNPTTLTFVNTHLAAFDEMVEKRNSDFHELSKRLLFENGTSTPASQGPSVPDFDEHNDLRDDDPPATPLSLGKFYDAEMFGLEVDAPLSIYETDVLFWLGDLNYRVDIPDLETRRILRDEDWDNGSKFEELLRFDQLKKAIKSRSAFLGFHEGDITHMPTYRFSPGIGIDSLGYDIKRKPAWTDRILYMHGSTTQITQISYASYPQITFSDHRPVGSDFYVDCDFYGAEEYRSNVRQKFNEVRSLDVETGHDKGGLRVDEMFIDFDKIFLGASMEHKVTIRNTGKSPCAFRFVPIQPGSPIHPEWLQIHPMTGILLADQATEVTLRSEVDDFTASLLNIRPKDVSTTLILHTMFGKDHFISISGKFQYTCFANRLERLIRLPGPARSLRSPNDLLIEGQSRNAPSEVMRLINWMMSNPASTNEIFISRGRESTTAAIRECLDTGDEFVFPPETSDVPIRLAFADSLLKFLNSMPEPVVPASLHARCVRATDRDEAFEILYDLPPASVNVWISLTAFIHYVCQSLSEDERRKIAFAVAPVLLRDDPDSTYLAISPMEKCKFLSFFIV